MFVLRSGNSEQILSYRLLEPGLSWIETFLTENHEFEDDFGRFVILISKFIAKLKEIVIPVVICNAQRNTHVLSVTCGETS